MNHDKELLEYRLTLEKFHARAQALNLDEREADKVLARVLQDYPELDALKQFQRAEHRLHFVAMGVPVTEEERIAARQRKTEQLMEEPRVGDIVLLRIKGWVGMLVWLLQAINGDLSKWTHVGVKLNGGEIFEAQPGGAIISQWSKYKDREWALVTKQQVRTVGEGTPLQWVLRDLKLTADDRMYIDLTARHYEKAPYNWGTYFYLAAYRVGIRPRWLKDRVQRPDRLICSQAADEIYSQAGVHLFVDGRMPCDVTPGDLADLT